MSADDTFKELLESKWAVKALIYEAIVTLVQSLYDNFDGDIRVRLVHKDTL